jgi:hypothetical protein
MAEQRHPYIGAHPTPWVTVQLEKADRSGWIDLDLAVDTGDFAEASISSDVFRDAVVLSALGQRTNFGEALGGWVRLRIPMLELVYWALV